MAFDAFYLSAVLEELRQMGDARVDKIHQPSRDMVILHLKGRDTRGKLLINPNPAAPRLHLTDANPENPAQPPMFCMLLRKHLLGARLTGISQPPATCTCWALTGESSTACAGWVWTRPPTALLCRD